MAIQLSHICLHVDLEGQAWGGFTAETETMDIYYPPGEGRYAQCTMPNVWPGLKEALRQAVDAWPDCERGTVRPFYAQIHYCLKNGEWTRWVVKHLDEADLARLGARS